MINHLLEIVAPHHCCGCQKTGTLLCDNCKYDIISEPFSQCVRCRAPTANSAVCAGCRIYHDDVWCAGERKDALEAMIDSYKFSNTIDATRALADVIADVLPELPRSTHIVPIPTIAPHIRERGYDHTLLMARRLRERCGYRVTPLLRRRTNSVQRQASRPQRLKQAQRAFRIDTRLVVQPDEPYLLLDDVYTTGATIEAATRLLRDAGARTVWVAVATREPLD